MITNQEVFNKAYLGLKAQEFRKSETEFGSCRYRNDRGDKCALGHCIPDGLYRDRMEGAGPVALLQAWPELEVYIGTNTEFLNQLQIAHDGSDNAHDMQDRLLDVATRYNLTVPEQDNANT